MTVEAAFQALYQGVMDKNPYTLEVLASSIHQEWLPELEKEFSKRGIKFKHTLKESEPVIHTSGSLLYVFELER